MLTLEYERAKDVSVDADPPAIPTPRTMRICHIMSDTFNGLPAGAEIQIARAMAYLLEQRGVSVTAVLFNDGPVARELRWLGLSAAVVGETSAIGMLRFLTRFLRDNDIDLVHTHQYRDSVLGTIAAKLAGVPYVVRTLHHLHEPSTGWRRVYESLDKPTLQCFADLVIVGSTRMAETLRDAGYRPTMVSQIDERSGEALLAAYRSVALTPKAGAARMGERRRKRRARQGWRKARPEPETLHVISAASRGGAADSPAIRPDLSPTRHVRRPTIGLLSLCWGLAREVVDYVERRLGCAVARHRMNGIRRDPVVLTSALRCAKRVLIVCHGNIIRSPFAARLLQRELGAAGTVSVSSAGLEAIPGRSPHTTALHLAHTLHVDLTGHSARRLAPDVVAESDVIFVMDIPQVVQLRKRFPEAGARTFLLTCLAPWTPLEVGDPIDGDASAFEACFNHISSAADPIVRVLSKSTTCL